MVILGLGSPSNSSVSRVQLAMALVMAEHLSVPHNAVELYDPVFTPIDQELFSECGFRVIARDESDRYWGGGGGGGAPSETGQGRKVQEDGQDDREEEEEEEDCSPPPPPPEEPPTFFFMPHCEAALYDGLLRVHWSARGALRGHAVLGNNFETYVDRWSHVSSSGERSNDERPRFVIAAAAAVKYKIVVDPGGTFGGAFNDTSVQVLNSIGDDGDDGDGFSEGVLPPAYDV